MTTTESRHTQTGTIPSVGKCGDGWTPMHVTRSLLGWGAVAGPFYVLVSLGQAVTRPGFDLTRHEWSLLENGDLGWVQVSNFVLTGLMLLAFAVGLRRALAGGPGDRWAPRLTGVFGAGLVAAGLLRADPALGFPVGTPEGVGVVTAHGIGHFAAAGVGFVAIAAACFVLGRRFRAEGGRRVSLFSRVTGVVFIGGFLCVASGAGSVAANLLFTGAVVLVFSWLAVVAVHLYRSLADGPAPTRS
ncbi:DUF998 domain-containing protein [Terrabacter sp. 2YAF2]|uniref:DUF998 domain-containing protein n=1 Tax=Terrabacter sp. 2YAF2 TaxID=3233026 RepID=UPI003F95B5D7